MMTISYEYEGALYVNLTNRCDCACVFCLRHNGHKGSIYADNLWLEHEPTRQEALDNLLARDFSQYRELVFCGFGEPMYRTDDIVWLVDELKKRVPNLPPVRINTNGHANLFLGRDVAPLLQGRVDTISISLNGSTPEEYCAVTKPRQGVQAWDAMLDFARECREYVPHVVMTIVDKDKTPEEIAPNTTARVPVFLSEDCRYFQDAYQGMPLEGYTPMFQSLLDHPDITVELGVDAASRLTLDGSAALLDGRPFSGPIIYTGAADELFGCKYGRLPYRTLDFRFETHPVDFWQSHGTVNYTVDQDYTRITEFKYLTGQELPGQTTIMKEYSRAYTGAKGEIPYYAIINAGNNALYAKYRAEADRYPNFHLLGRLAEYKYYNMDAIAARALELCDDLLK